MRVTYSDSFLWHVCMSDKMDWDYKTHWHVHNFFTFSGIGTKCHYDTHCIENAFCRHQLMCFCKKDYYPSDDHWTCIGERISIFFLSQRDFLKFFNSKSNKIHPRVAPNFCHKLSFSRRKHLITKWNYGRDFVVNLLRLPGYRQR